MSTLTNFMSPGLRKIILVWFRRKKLTNSIAGAFDHFDPPDPYNELISLPVCHVQLLNHLKLVL